MIDYFFTNLNIQTYHFCLNIYINFIYDLLKCSFYNIQKSFVTIKTTFYDIVMYKSIVKYLTYVLYKII